MIIPRKEIRKSLSLLPEGPGCYLYRNKSDVVIYVGKAKNLKRRLSSYFNREPDSPKTRALLRNFATIEYMVVTTEHDALLLENNLIKQYQPRYNILLKEGNSYPYICIKREPFPRVFVTHKVERDGSRYFGPYPSRSMAWTLNRLFRKVYKFRTCSLDLTEDKIQRGRFRVCLKYHIGRCKGPCEELQSKREYDKEVRDAISILNGKIRVVTSTLREEITKAAEELDFESAISLKDILTELDNYQGKSTIISDTIGDALAASFGTDSEAIYVNYFVLSDGNITSGRTLEYRRQLEDEEPSELFATILLDLLGNLPIEIKELILPQEVAFSVSPGAKITIPRRGERKHVLELSEKNVRQYMEDKQKQQEKMNPEQRNIQILLDLQKTVGLPTLPFHVECFDNSNIQGTNPVAACVVFKGGKPSKADYRLYHIKGVTGPDDYASMREVVTRRYTRVMEAGEKLPDLIITDGGRGHMSVVKEALAEIGATGVEVLGLAKDDTHNTSEVLYGDPPQVIGIMMRSQAFYLLERIQKEVHRFAIEFHRKVRSKAAIQSALDDIPGIGEVNKEKLLRVFKSVPRIKKAPLEDLQNAIGKVKGKVVFDFFNTTESSPQ